MKRLSIIAIVLLLSLKTTAQMNNPYVDDKLVHFGFYLGTNFMGYSIKDSNLPINGETYHARVSSVLPGFSVGFITDLRISRHLNFRFTPGLNFGQRTITYKAESGRAIRGSEGNNEHIEVLSLPINLPVYLKWSAEREKNYRPYLIFGGGASYDFGGSKERPIYTQKWDYYIDFGFGVDLYFAWFKLCPEIKYQIGFANMKVPVEQRPELPAPDHFYTNALDRLRNQMITITFNFE
ncbi:MAG: PorT family protein [Paludibacteraceae bacterium]|nr:PorT family protein [Paludibacteraceae bacterium]